MFLNEEEVKLLIHLLIKEGKEISYNKYGHLTISDGCGSIGVDINYLEKDSISNIFNYISEELTLMQIMDD